MAETPSDAATADVATDGPARRRDRSGGELFSGWGALAFLLPAIVVVGIFLVIPALWTLQLGATNRRLIHPGTPDFVGLDNYRDAVGDARFTRALRNTLVYVLGSAIVGQAVLGFALAWMFRTWQTWTRRLLELLVVFAWIIPTSVVAFLWRAFLDHRDGGTLNLILGTSTRWLLDHEMLSIIVFNIWRGTAFSMLLFSAALNTLPPSYLETARLAGASVRQQLTGVVLPSIKGYILTNLLLISLWTFNDFGPFLLIGGGLGRRTEVLPVYLFNEAIRFERLGYASAIAAIIMLINLVIATIYLRAGRARRTP